MTLPFSRTVNVTVSRSSNFPSRRGFGVPLVLTTKKITGVLDADKLTKYYGSMQEVGADFATTDAFYSQAKTVFSQNPRPLQIKAGYISKAGANVTKEELEDGFNEILDSDNSFYWLLLDSGFKNAPNDAVDALIARVETTQKQLLLDSSDALMKDKSNTTNVAARNKGKFERTSVFYSEDGNLAAAVAAYGATRNFDDSNAAYTMKYKRFNGISTLNEKSSAVQAITGFVPQIGQDSSSGHNVNCYVDIGGTHVLVEGSTLTPNVFIDEIHSTDWIKSRSEEEILKIKTNNPSIPYTDQGMELLATGVRNVMQIARSAGIIAQDLNPETSEYQSSVIIDVPSVFNVPESQRKSRISPAISTKFRYAGSVHYTTINYSVEF